MVTFAERPLTAEANTKRVVEKSMVISLVKPEEMYFPDNLGYKDLPYSMFDRIYRLGQNTHIPGHVYKGYTRGYPSLSQISTHIHTSLLRRVGTYLPDHCIYLSAVAWPS